jgi:hypothetical protein
MTELFPALQTDLSGEIKEPRLLRLYRYWCERKGSRRFPRRADIDPLDFSYILGYVMLIDVSGDPPPFRVRLHGTEMVARVGYELTGKTLYDLPNSDYRDYALARCTGLLASGEPMVVHHNRSFDGKMRRYEALWLPFSENGATVTMLLCALIYDWERR